MYLNQSRITTDEPLWYQAFNPTSMHQYHTASQPIPHASFYTSTNLTAPLRDPEANINGDQAAASDVTTAKASQIDTQCIHTVEGDSGNDKDIEERYVVLGGNGSL